ncbi:WD repeat and HMG-box DNA-binding protein 1 [Antennarius striatus]|uniref:WD repeat and HMG-box DNA-binding protein 1 n=1 Tax=Antennarius striatus TaxID=241820 RepID=UPI0035B376E3
MPCERKPMRYGHAEGHTEVCFDDTGRVLVTCGSDGDVRIWDGLDDDDPKFFTVGEKVFSVALKGNKLVTAGSNHLVQVHSYPQGDPEGILTRFTASPTHVTFNPSGSRVAAGASDFLVKVVEVADSSQQRTLRGHQAPILSVAFDPRDHFLASASCDGSVAVWNIEEQTRVISWSLLNKTNDVTNAASLCRLAWQPGAGKLLAVPVQAGVHLYERGSWEHVSSLSDDQLTQPINVVSWSPCGRFLAAGGVGGSLTIWDVPSKLCVERQKHERGFSLCALCWHPGGGQLAYTDTEGRLGLLDGFCPPGGCSDAPDLHRLFDEDDDGLMDEGQSDTRSPRATAPPEDDDDDDVLVPPTGRVRSRGAVIDDDNSQDTGSVRPRDEDEDDDEGGAPVPPPRPVYEGPLPTPPQKAFQPSSTPRHLTHRFMVWNSVGVVRAHRDEHEAAVEVEFHDSAVHHALHLADALGHALAALSHEAVLLACPSTDQLASKLQCLHFSSWDTCKEWTVDLPPGEDAQALCLGRGWGAVATSALMLRLFSVGGLQRGVFSLPGPPVCVAAHGEQLAIVYHRGTGFHGDQALGVQLLQLGRRPRQVISDAPLPLSPRAHLTWMGFSTEGTPCYVDSVGVVRMLNLPLGLTWTPVCNTRDTCKSQSDHYWVVGVQESPQQLRCIPCKGSRYPPTLPRPAVAILPFKLPLCQTGTEKGQLEEQFWRSVLFHAHFLSGEEEEEQEERCRAEKEQQELLMKMFALSCRLQREFRCAELADLMTPSVVPLAVRYASRSRRLALAERLSQLALEKANQIAEEEEEEEPDSSTGASGFSRRHGAGGRHSNGCQEEEEQQEEEDEEEGGQEVEAESRKCQSRSSEPPPSHACPPPGGNPFRDPAPAQRASPANRGGRSNPFKMAGVALAPPRALNILDSMTPSRKGTPPSGRQPKEPPLKPLAPRSKTQSTLLPRAKASNQKPRENTEAPPPENPPQQEAPPPENPPQQDVPPPSSPADGAENKRPQTGFQLWLDHHRCSIRAERPHLEETDVIKEAMGRFRALPPQERLSWTERARRPPADDSDLRKRRRDEGGDDDDGRRKRRPDVLRLKSFSFHKD